MNLYDILFIYKSHQKDNITFNCQSLKKSLKTLTATRVSLGLKIFDTLPIFTLQIFMHYFIFSNIPQTISIRLYIGIWNEVP